MIEIPGWIYYGVSEVIIVLIITIIFLSYKVYKLKRNNSKEAPVNTGYQTEFAKKIAFHEQISRKLEKYRDVFIDLKNKFISYGKFQDQVFSKIDNALPGTDSSSSELIDVLGNLKIKYEQLNQNIHLVESKLSMLIEESQSLKKSKTIEENNAIGVSDILSKQQTEIQKLKKYLGELKMGAQSENKIGTSIDDLERNNHDLTVSLEILQDENKYLQAQLEN